jgi:hypothetical protein
MIITSCPTCLGDIIILEEEINCSIFRHAVYKNGCEVNPHTPEVIMKNMIQCDMIFGCGSPFRLVIKEGVYTAETCDWI